jgi:multidrug resistance efflux pump
MTVNTIGQSTYASGLQQKQQNMNNMFAALKSGDLAAAQKAYASSGMPPMAANNTSPLGRLYQALRHEDLTGAQKAALDMQGKNAKNTSTAASATPTNANTSTTPAQKAAAALAQASLKAQQSSVLAMLGQGTHVNTWG